MRSISPTTFLATLWLMTFTVSQLIGKVNATGFISPEVNSTIDFCRSESE